MWIISTDRRMTDQTYLIVRLSPMRKLYWFLFGEKIIVSHLSSRNKLHLWKIIRKEIGIRRVYANNLHKLAEIYIKQRKHRSTTSHTYKPSQIHIHICPLQKFLNLFISSPIIHIVLSISFRVFTSFKVFNIPFCRFCKNYIKVITRTDDFL